MTTKVEEDSTTLDGIENVELFSEGDAAELMALLMDRLSSSTPSATILASPKTGTFMTLSGLKAQIGHRLGDTFQGRCHVEQVAHYFGCSEDDVRQAMTTSTSTSPTSKKETNHNQAMVYSLSATNFSRQEDVVVEYVTDNYLDRAVDDMKQLLDDNIGFMLVSEMLQSLPTSDYKSTSTSSSTDNQTQWLQLLKGRLVDHEIETRTLENGSRVFVLQSYWKTFCTEVYRAMASASRKIIISTFCHDHKWDAALVREALCHPPSTVQDLRPPGEMQGTDCFLPDSHKQTQQKLVTESFQFHGFVLVRELCAKADLTSAQLIKYILDYGGKDVIVLDNQEALLSRARILSQWIALLQEANETKSWCEFPVPIELFAACGGKAAPTRQELLENCLLTQMPSASDSHGVFGLTQDGNALYVSASVVDSLTKVHLPKFISRFAAEQARAFVNVKPSQDMTTESVSEWLEDSSSYMPAVNSFIDMVVQNYPEIGEESSHAGTTNENEETVLYDFCRNAFMEENQSVEKLCKDALVEQVHKYIRQRQAGLGVVHVVAEGPAGDDAGEIVDEVLVPFEDPDCFVAACFQLQSFVKFYDYAVKHEMESVDKLEREILSRTCVDFTRRIHQYCMTMHEDLPPFVFSFQDRDNASRRLPLYCSAIDIAARQYGPSPVINCSPDPDSGKERDPGTVLRELLPGNVGRALSEMYLLCLEESENATTPSLKAFLEHAEEHTLTICGLPFKKLDKKHEKTFLAARKQEMKSRLEKAKQAQQVLELTIMILYQSTKNQSVAGSLLTTSVLYLLLKERKISAPVGECLTQLASKLNDNEKPDPLLVESVRDCGLCKDIAKHVVS